MKQIGLLVAWLSGSLAGITAGLYALGFVATIGADALLGIDAALNVRDPAFYIGRGASLLVRTLLIGMLSALPVIALGEAIGWLGRCQAIARVDGTGRVRRALGAAVTPAASFGMLSLALVGLDGYILPSRAARDLLFTDEIAADICRAADPLTLAIFAQQRDALDSGFTAMALIAGGVVGLAVIARERLADPGRGLWLSLAAIAGFLVLIQVPLAYGFMAVEIAPHRIEVAAPPGTGEGPLRLLARSAGGLLLWREHERRVLWIRDSEVATFTIGAGAPIAPIGCGDPRRF